MQQVWPARIHFGWLYVEIGQKMANGQWPVAISNTVAAAALQHLHHSGVAFTSNNIACNVTYHILCMDLAIITTTIADEWLNNLIFPDNK